MEANTFNKKDTSYRTFCHVCLSRDRRLFSIEKYANIFQNICEGKFTAETLLCWECTAELKRIKKFKERVELSTKILNKYVNKPDYPFNSLSNLKICEKEATDLIKYQESGQIDNIKEEIVVNSSNDNYNPIIINSLEESEESIDIKQEFSDHDDDIVFNDTDNFENNDPYLEVKSKETPSTDDKGKHKKRIITKQYRIIPYDVKDVKSLAKRVILTAEEVKSYMDEQRLSVYYKKKAYRCEQCACSWNSETRFLQHNKKYHAKSAGKYQCDICFSRFKIKKDLALHIRRHFVILECCICAYRSYSYTGVMRGHLKSHHKKFECIECNARFCKIYLFRQHHNELHHIFICDICGIKAKSKKFIEKHIGGHFEKYECKLCDRKYKLRKSFQRHQEDKHSPRTADVYCVQCDKKFCNTSAYRNHLLRSSAHAAREGEGAAKKVPCPDCGRQYYSRVYMNKHYMHVHMKQSMFFCEQCNKHFLFESRYQEHVKYKHEGVKRKKDKLCNICGRGFTENRILNNHIRTHTGDRPHECSYCGAKFIQPYAMRMHINNIHLKNKRPNLK